MWFVVVKTTNQRRISKTQDQKVAALKLQLDFRKKALEQKHTDKTLFFLTKNKTINNCGNQ